MIRVGRGDAAVADEILDEIDRQEEGEEEEMENDQARPHKIGVHVFSIFWLYFANILLQTINGNKGFRPSVLHPQGS